jgi:ribonuclease-3
MPGADERIERLSERIGAPLENRAAALAALTHKSYANEHRSEALEDNERLEFLGDAAIDLAVSHRLMERLPGAREGELSKLRAAVVNEDGLAAVASRAGLGELLLLGRGEELSGGRVKPSLLADALEAVIGAVYLEGGQPAVLGLVDRLFADALERAVKGTVGRDFKTELQELAQARFGTAPRYRVVSERGPDHSKLFTVELEISGRPLGRGEGRSKKEAEQLAASEGLERIQDLSAEPPFLPDAPDAGKKKRQR